MGQNEAGALLVVQRATVDFFFPKLLLREAGRCLNTGARSSSVGFILAQQVLVDTCFTEFQCPGGNCLSLDFATAG